MILTLFLTLDCNQRCTYCYAAPHKRESLTLEKAKKAITLTATELAKKGDQYLGVRFFGGEPLLEWDIIPQLVEFVNNTAEQNSLSPSFAISTNGILLNDYHINFFYENDFAVGLSLDGLKEPHDLNRKFPDGSSSHSLAMQSALKMRAADLRMELVLVVDPSNISFLAHSLRYLITQTDVHFFTLSFNIHANWSNESFKILEQVYDSVADLYVEFFNKGEPIQIDMFNNKINVLLRGGYIRKYLCDIGNTDLAITPKGIVYPCLRLATMDTDESLSIGNIEDGINNNKIDSLNQVSSDRFNQLAQTDNCHFCPNTNFCLSWCAAANLAMNNNPARIGLDMCKHEKIVISAAKKIISTIDMELYEKLYSEYLSGSKNTISPAVPHGDMTV